MRDSYLLCGAQHEDIWIQRRELGGVELNRDRLRKLFLSDISFLHLLNFGNSLCLHHYKSNIKDEVEQIIRVRGGEPAILQEHAELSYPLGSFHQQ